MYTYVYKSLNYSILNSYFSFSYVAIKNVFSPESDLLYLSHPVLYTVQFQLIKNHNFIDFTCRHFAQ